MMGQCTAIKANGERCRLAALPQLDVCWAHDPSTAEQRRRTAARGGRGTSNTEVRDLKREVKDLIAAVKAGEQDRNAAAVMLQGYRVLRDYLELERKIRTTDELAAEIAAIREELDRRDRAQA